MNTLEDYNKPGSVWRSKNGDLYYVKNTNNSLEYCKIYEIEDDELHCRDQNGNEIAIHF